MVLGKPHAVQSSEEVQVLGGTRQGMTQRDNYSREVAKAQVFLLQASHAGEEKDMQRDRLSMQLEIGIVHTQRQTYGISTRQDDPNTLTRPPAGTNYPPPPQGPASRPHYNTLCVIFLSIELSNYLKV